MNIKMYRHANEQTIESPNESSSSTNASMILVLGIGALCLYVSYLCRHCCCWCSNTYDIINLKSKLTISAFWIIYYWITRCNNRHIEDWMAQVHATTHTQPKASSLSKYLSQLWIRFDIYLRWFSSSIFD